MSDSQTIYLMQGGPVAPHLRKLRERKLWTDSYEYREYPKMLHLSQGVQEIKRSTDIGDGRRTREWTETKEVFQHIIVNSEEEEERVLAGGKTSVQQEEDRQALIVRCAQAGINVDPNWTAVRLRRELGDKMNAPAPDQRAALQARLAELEEIAAMRDKIAALEAKLAAPAAPAADEEDMRAQLATLGVKVDGRWSTTRLREELERATAPRAA